jgi:hypothetical protein
MFVKLLALLFSNIFVSFSVLMCIRSLIEKCGLRVEISKGIEGPCQCDRAHDHVSPSYLRSHSTIAYALCHGNIEESSVLERTKCN